MEQGKEESSARVDRRVFIIGTLHGESDERDYWQRQTPQQRLAHVERLRRINYGPRATERLQRVLELAQREQR